MGLEVRYRYRTPGPGAYEVREASRQCLKTAPVVAFGGCLNRVDRVKTGPLKVIGEKEFVPGPCFYAVEADYQARDLCTRPQTCAFTRASREDISKLFFGKDAVAYMTRRTPGPGAYDVHRQHPRSVFPTRKPGTSIGGPLANVDRLQTGPLGPSLNSCTPGPGAYIHDNASNLEMRASPPRKVGQTFAKVGDSRMMSFSGHTLTPPPPRRTRHLYPPRSITLRGMDRSRRIVDLRSAPESRRAALDASLTCTTATNGGSVTSQSPWIPRPTTAHGTFGKETREQAGQVLAPGFKGCTPQSVLVFPGPGSYRNVPGSLGLQIDSRLHTSASPSFTQRSHLGTTRKTRGPGPGTYETLSSLGSQVSSKCTTAPAPKFGTSLRPALEDGLVG